jgi:DNA mismatch endonuclease (patch repair protein)
MTDVFTSEKRSEIMRRVHGKDTSPEKAVRSLLHRIGYRFRLHRADLPGRPDIVFPSRRKVIFIHGCFWHGHDCPRGSRTPKTNPEYWKDKIKQNFERDHRHCEDLKVKGWCVLVIWECELKNLQELEKKLREFLNNY